LFCSAVNRYKRNTIFAFQELNPEQFGIIKIDSNGKVILLKKNRSNQDLILLYKLCN